MKMIRISAVLIVFTLVLQTNSFTQTQDSVQSRTSFWKYSKWVFTTLTVAMGSFYFIEKENNKPTEQFLSAAVMSGGLAALAFIMDAFSGEEYEKSIQRKPAEEEKSPDKRIIASSKPDIIISGPRPDEKNRIISGQRKVKLKGYISNLQFGCTLIINNNSVLINSDNSFFYDLSLLEDINLVSIVLRNSDGILSEKNLVVTLKQESLERKGSDYALLFAIDNYDNWNSLLNPVNDVKTIESELKNNYNFITEKVINGAKNEIYSVLRKYAQMQFKDDDQLFVFFAGHGKFDDIFKEGFLVVRDSRKEDENNDSYISHAILKQRIDNIPCKHIFLVVDACFGGALDPVIAQSDGRGDNLYSEITKPEFIKRKLKFKTRKYLTSGGKEYVPDGRPGEHSPFARKLLEALRSYGGSDGILTLSKLNNYIEKVKPEPRFGGFGSDEPGSDFIFIAK